jgi:hypothetical protein
MIVWASYMGYRSIVRSALLTPLLTIVAALAAPVSAPAYLYWGAGASVARAALDGHGVNMNFIRGSVEDNTIGAVTVSNQYIYFAGDRGQIGRASVDGRNVEPDFFTIPQPALTPSEEHTQLDAGALAVGGTHIFWSTGDNMVSEGLASNAIGRANLDGGEIEPDFIGTGAPAFGVHTYGGYIYWFNEHGIVRANLDGGQVDQAFIPMNDVSGITIANGYIYWTSDLGHSIGRANINGREVDSRFISGLSFIFGVTVAGRFIYWDTEEKHGEGRNLSGPIWIGRANINGGSIRRNFISTPQLTGKLASNQLGPSPLNTVRHFYVHHTRRGSR